MGAASYGLVLWGDYLLKQGWDFVGRLRYNTFVKTTEDNEWKNVKQLHDQATSTPKFLGRFLVARNNPLEVNTYLFLEKSKGRIKKTRHGKKCHSSNSNKYSRSVKEPWGLISSLQQNHVTAKNVAKLYRVIVKCGVQALGGVPV